MGDDMAPSYGHCGMLAPSGGHCDSIESMSTALMGVCSTWSIMPDASLRAGADAERLSLVTSIHTISG